MRHSSSGMVTRFLSLVVLTLLGCQGESAGEGIQLLEPWARPVLVGVDEDGVAAAANSAIYLSIRNGGKTPDRLLGCETSVALRVEIHESFQEGDIMKMREVGPLALPSREEVRLEPGGLHLMLLGVQRTLAVGDSVPLTLHFEEAGSVDVWVPVGRVQGR